MATARIPLPEKLELGQNSTERWQLFKQRWENYLKISDFTGDGGEERKKATFLHCLGDDALKAYNSFNNTDTATVTQIIIQFDNFIIGDKNVTYERYVFNKRRQREGETFDMFYADVQRLIKTCEYCGLCRNSIKRDKIVLGINDAQLQKELLKDRNLTLDKCVDICKADENAKNQNIEMNPEHIRKINYKYKRNNKSVKYNYCKFCGNKHVWDKENCPAYGKICAKCKKENHFASVCKNKAENKSYNYKKSKSDNRKSRRKVNSLKENDENNYEYSSDSSQSEWVNNIGDTINRKRVKCVMVINRNKVNFQIDTGSSVNIIPVRYVNKYEKTHVELKTWKNDKYQPLGECRLHVRNPKSNKLYNVRFIVCHNNFDPILGLRASEQMKLINVNNDNFERVNVIDNNFDSVFDNKIGTIGNEHKLKVRSDAQPIIMANRKVPISQREPLKKELDRLVNLGVITPVSEPTEWVSQTVITAKKNGKIRLCLDPRELNKVLLREHYTLPVIDDTLHELRQSKIFSKADLASGYWHIKLDNESSMLTTFQTCFGRFRWLRLPFGLNVSSEIFQRKLFEAFSDLEGIICIADDIIIHGKDENEHDERMNKFLERCLIKGIKLNKDKLFNKVDAVTFMGHKITKDGLEVDEEKIKAVKNFPSPSNVTQLRSFLGLVNFVSKFVQNSAKTLHPLNNLLKNNVEWHWSESQQNAFDLIKKKIAEATILCYYDPNKELILENDASEYGLGSTLLQDGRPIAYASRSLTVAERNYAQIEKELLAINFGLNKFHYYVFGRTVHINTDHKPLENIADKPLAVVPKRMQQMLIKLKHYDTVVKYKPGKSIPVADALSRLPLKESRDVFSVSNYTHTDIKEHRLSEIRKATESDKILQDLKAVIANGWPENKIDVPTTVSAYYSYRDELTLEDGIIFRGDRVVIPTSL